MRTPPTRWLVLLALGGLGPFVAPPRAEAACCYFSAKDQDILQPAQKVFLTWDPTKQVETFTVQPKFEGNARDFGMVIPTPARPKLHEMPRDFFKELAVYTIMKRRESPASKLLPAFGGFGMGMGGFPGMGMGGMGMGGFAFGGTPAGPRPQPPVRVVEAGLVGSLDYKVIEADRADALFAWLKEHKYSYAGDEATLNFYVQKKWVFTVMKIDTMQMKKNKDGSYSGEVTPTRFTFTTDKLVYPLRITQISVKDKTEALFYVQAPFKTDLEGDLSYQHQWVPMLQAASGCTPGGLPGKGAAWLKAIEGQIPALLKRSQELEYAFTPGARPEPNKQGRTPTTMEWARRLTAADVLMLQGKAAYSERVPNPDEGFTQADLKDPRPAQAIYRVIQQRLSAYSKLRPNGFLVREAPAADVRNLRLLLGHLQQGRFVTKFRKIFTRDEMADDLTIVAARLGQDQDSSEYEEILPVSPP